MPDEWFITAFLSGAGQAQIIAFLLVLTFAIHIKGKPLADFNTALKEGMMWQLWFMLMSALTIANALTSEQTGVMPLISQFITPFFDGKGLFMLAALSTILAAVGTNIINNSVVSVILVPICSTISVDLGYSPAIVTTMIIFACSIGIALPTGSPAGAMAFANKKWIPGNNVLVFGMLTVALHTVLLIVLGYPFLSLLF